MRSESFCTTTPVKPSSTSMMTSSIGSSLAPSCVGLVDDLRARHGQLEALAAHVLDQDAELQLAAAGNVESVLVVGDRNLDRDVALGFLHQAVEDDAALHLVAFLAGERTVIDAERHRQRRRIDGLGRQGRLDRRIAQRVGDGRLAHAGDGDDLAGFGLFDRHALEAAEGQHLLHAEVLDELAFAIERLERLAGLEHARGDAAGQDAAEERIGFQRRRQHAHGPGLNLRRRHVRQHEVEHRGKAFLRARRIERHPAVAARTIEHREVELLVGGIEIGEKVEDLVQHVEVALVGAVDLVDGDDRAKAALQAPWRRRTSFAAAGLRTHRPARRRRRPCSGCARPRRRSRRGPAYRRC